MIGPALTAREVEVVALVAEGLSNAAAGEALGISARTVGTHLFRVGLRLGASGRVPIVAAAYRDGWLRTPGDPRAPKPRFCEACDGPMERRRFPSGQLEGRSQFAGRRFCSRACFRKAAAGRLLIGPRVLAPMPVPRDWTQGTPDPITEARELPGPFPQGIPHAPDRSYTNCEHQERPS